MIAKAANALEVKLESIKENDKPNGKTQFKTGMKICFTGKATDKNGDEIFRDTLISYAMKAGYVSVDDVTKKECDLVVAEDKSSMSGKAKKARKFGIPVISVQEFLDTL